MEMKVLYPLLELNREDFKSILYNSNLLKINYLPLITLVILLALVAVLGIIEKKDNLKRTFISTTVLMAIIGSLGFAYITMANNFKEIKAEAITSYIWDNNDVDLERLMKREISEILEEVENEVEEDKYRTLELIADILDLDPEILIEKYDNPNAKLPIPTVDISTLKEKLKDNHK